MQLSQWKQSLLNLVKEAYEGKVMLPDFQRPFVWTRLEIEELIESLLENMFIWTFLINYTKADDTKFKVIPIDWAEKVNSNYIEQPHTLILDGQQRITSIFYALYEPDRALINTKHPYRFFINLDKLLLRKNDHDEWTIEDVVISWSSEWSEYKTLLDQDWNYKIDLLKEKKLLPLKLLNWDFSETRFTNEQWWYNEEDWKQIRELIKNITDYQVMTIDVPVNESLINIAKLFEKTNRTWIKLSVFDLLTARLYKFINLRHEREESFDENYNIKKFVENKKRDTKLPYHIIQAIALASWFKTIKSKDILWISEKELNEDTWNRAIDIVENRILTMFFQIDEFGIGNEYWISYKHMIIVYLAIFLNWKQDIEKIKNRHRASLFTERYSWSTESKITKDYKDLLKRFDEESTIPTVVKNAREILLSFGDVFSLSDKNYSGSASYKWVFNLLFMNKANDFYVRDTIKYNVSDLDDHHIFPKNFLERKLWKSWGNSINYDTVLNKTLILSSTNRKISSKAPWDYIKEMIDVFGSENRVKEILKSHFIDEQMFWILKEIKEDSDPAFILSQFNSFIKQREKLIKEKVKALVWIMNEEAAIQDIDKFIDKADENKAIEFKSTLRWNMHQNCDWWKAIEHNVLKTINAFLNSEGGELVIGIDDSKNTVWLQKDYNVLWNKWNRDWFTLHIDNLIQSSLGNQYQWLIKLDFFEKNGEDIAVVFIKRSNSPVFLKYEWEKVFYIRRNGSSIKLDNEEMNNYISQHF